MNLSNGTSINKAYWAGLPWPEFKTRFDQYLADKVNESAEEVYKLIGGNPPKKDKKGGE
jgi:hypothetical protein